MISKAVCADCGSVVSTPKVGLSFIRCNQCNLVQMAVFTNGYVGTFKIICGKVFNDKGQKVFDLGFEESNGEWETKLNTISEEVWGDSVPGVRATLRTVAHGLVDRLLG